MKLNTKQAAINTSMYPIIDQTGKLTGEFVDANYPQEFNGGRWMTAAIENGVVLVGEHFCEYAIATEEGEEEAEADAAADAKSEE